jgi:hypothetical protein
MFGTTQREWALNMTIERRTERLANAYARWAKRRQLDALRAGAKDGAEKGNG